MNEAEYDREVLAVNDTLARALDPRTGEQEARGAGADAISAMRRLGLGIRALRALERVTDDPADASNDPDGFVAIEPGGVAGVSSESDEGEKLEQYKTMEIPFGKYKGETIEQVAKKDPSYIKWIVDRHRKNATRPRIIGVAALRVGVARGIVQEFQNHD